LKSLSLVAVVVGETNTLAAAGAAGLLFMGLLISLRTQTRFPLSLEAAALLVPMVEHLTSVL
jgi:hypothetical protein